MFSREESEKILFDDLDKGIVHVPQISMKVYEQYFYQAMCTLRQRGIQKVTALFNTSGGCVPTGFHFYDLLRSYPGEVTGIIESRCSSMGVVVFQACAKRIVRSGSVMGLHWGTRQLSLTDIEWLDPVRVAHEVGRAKLDVDRYDAVVLKHFKGDKDALWRLYKDEMEFYGQEIVDAGLADELLEK